MTLPMAALGDGTSHGGKIIKVSGTVLIDGRLAARIGDWVSCPMHGDNQIVEGSGFPDNGINIVTHGCKCQCGCTIIATGRATVA